MKINYINHSSFLLEEEGFYILFDYFDGELPDINKNKKLYVMASHSHRDHFDKIVFDIFKGYNVEYILSRDIYKKYKIEQPNISYVYANKDYENRDFKFTTLKSTDLGVAFLINVKDKYIYHSGDLHNWAWFGESKAWNNNMEANFKREIEKLKDINIFTAFLPLDPRQEDWYYKGMEYTLKNVNIKYAFPMHSWGEYSIIQKYVDEGHFVGNTNIIRVSDTNNFWEV